MNGWGRATRYPCCRGGPADRGTGRAALHWLPDLGNRAPGRVRPASAGRRAEPAVAVAAAGRSYPYNPTVTDSDARTNANRRYARASAPEGSARLRSRYGCSACPRDSGGGGCWLGPGFGRHRALIDSGPVHPGDRLQRSRSWSLFDPGREQVYHFSDACRTQVWPPGRGVDPA